MRIIKKDEKERIKKCKFCNTKFAYKMEDVFESLGFDTRCVECPICNKWNIISKFDRSVKSK